MQAATKGNIVKQIMKCRTEQSTISNTLEELINQSINSTTNKIKKRFLLLHICTFTASKRSS